MAASGSTCIALNIFQPDATFYLESLPCSSQLLPPATHPCMRGYSSVHTQQPAGPIREYNIDPYILLDEELKYIFEDIRQEINRATNHQELEKIAVYYFDGQGKAIRPMVAMLMAKALNYHMHNETSEPPRAFELVIEPVGILTLSLNVTENKENPFCNPGGVTVLRS
ncbi:all trans-polyprenyl-diphosphate synthase PDSS1-like [Topomyia yanbarensis]|uniref:all trans-polyprenyl-diphosphate synthase PDSS1-like n=1 Tax=Topomyia yanbarensis TaxID=2498891 RepID=UPI00273C869C|nr:all trans-polyprenyl-diphosphate synthase PDSS1-like [Topomyia yanbarensis]